jgi:hypothetical protein
MNPKLRLVGVALVLLCIVPMSKVNASQICLSGDSSCHNQLTGTPCNGGRGICVATAPGELLDCTCNGSVPAMTSWGLLAVAVGLLSIGTMVVYRRRQMMEG